MKKNTTTLAMAALMIVASATISSCKKDTKTTGNTTVATSDTNTSSAKDHQEAENSSNDVDQMGAEGVDNGNVNSNYKLTANGGGLLTPMSGSANVSTVAKVTTITFSNYVGLDGHLRNGTLTYDCSAAAVTSVTPHFRDSGLVIVVSSSNYYVDSNKVDISKTITNMGRLSTNNHNLTWHSVTSLTITKVNGGGTITWSSDRYHTLLNTSSFSFNSGTISANAAFSGYSAPINWSIAVMGVTDVPSGNGTHGTSADGVTFNSTISSMLVRNFGCHSSLLHTSFHPFVAGQIDFTPTGKTTRSINFGTGVCDETYMITIGSWNTTITWIW